MDTRERHWTGKPVSASTQPRTLCRGQGRILNGVWPRACSFAACSGGFRECFLRGDTLGDCLPSAAWGRLGESRGGPEASSTGERAACRSFSSAQTLQSLDCPQNQHRPCSQPASAERSRRLAQAPTYDARMKQGAPDIAHLITQRVADCCIEGSDCLHVHLSSLVKLAHQLTHCQTYATFCVTLFVSILDIMVTFMRACPQRELVARRSALELLLPPILHRLYARGVCMASSPRKLPRLGFRCCPLGNPLDAGAGGPKVCMSNPKGLFKT